MSLTRINEDRILIKAASPAKITGKWKEIVQNIIETCEVHLGKNLVSVYIGGSLPFGAAIENKSDVDSYAIVNLNKEEIEKADAEWVSSEEKRIDSLFPFQRGIEMHLIPIGHMPEGKKFQIKVLAACVYGKDFDQELPEYKLDQETLGRIRVDIAKDIEIARKELDETDDPGEIQKISVWITKRLIRGAGMTVLWKGDFYTMNVELLGEMFISHYPDQKENMNSLLKIVREKKIDKKTIFSILDSFGAWLVKEDKRVFGSK